MNVATVPSLPAAALMRAAAIRVLVLLRPTIAMLVPSAASASAAANPMPLVAPRDQDLLVAHGTTIQGSGHAIKDLALDQVRANGASQQGIKKCGAELTGAAGSHTSSTRRVVCFLVGPPMQIIRWTRVLDRESKELSLS
jgi:hypothetical protein